MTELAKYDAMCSAIAECHRVDEVAEIKNKARALEVYAAQAQNRDAERRASEIRLRAEYRIGELLKELARATPSDAGKASGIARTNGSNDATRSQTPYAEALQRTGISRQTANRYEALANVPKETFEAALREPTKPTTNAILEKGRAMAQVHEARDPQPRMPADALWLWGRMNDFERDGYAKKNPADLLEQMTDAMRDDVLRIAPLMADFFGRIKEFVDEPA